MTFYDQLKQAIDEWNKEPINDEWLFEKFREKSINQMSPIEAFEKINETIDVLLLQSDESTAIEVLQTLIALARHSDTTEIPLKLHTNSSALTNQFSIYGDYAKNKLQELFQHYRIL
jgi:hypothetical protein